MRHKDLAFDTYKRFTRDLSMADWQARIDAMTTDQKRVLDDQCAAAAERLARLSAYISRRMSGGNHQAAVKRQNEVGSKVRRALGFTYSGNDITF